MSDDDHAGQSYVFISYASSDAARVLPVLTALTASGIPVWRDQDDIAGGTSYGPAIASAIRSSRAVIIFCSHASLSSRNVRQEMAIAWKHERPCLPLLLDPMLSLSEEVEYWLEGAQWIEVLDNPEHVWLPRVTSALEHLGVVTQTRAAQSAPISDPRHRPPATPVLSIPTPLTDLIGRQTELAELGELVTAERIVTLTGPGGTGKTRLAIAVAHAVSLSFRDGVVVVELAAIRDPGLVIPTIAAALGVRESGDEPLLASLTRVLAGRYLMLVLDNFEQVVDAAAAMASLMVGCPYLHVLATSRVPLHISGEHEYPVSPLPTPHVNATVEFENVAAAPAVALFIARARAVKRDFSLTPENAVTIAAICRRLDGLPLAIELAAARIKLLSPQAILTRLDRPLTVLTGGARDLPTRQQTLRDAIAWSYDLLDADTQRLFRAVSIFRGGCTVETVEMVVGDDLGGDVLDGFANLVEHSLLQVHDQPDGTVRYTLLETIREYALAQLAEHDEIDRLRRRHLALMLSLVEQAEVLYRRAGASGWFARLDAEHDNLRSALHWAVEHEPLVALELCQRAGRFWYVHGYLTEGIHWLTAALAKNDAGPPVLRAKALIEAGGIAIAQGDFPRALALHSQARTLAFAAGDMSLVCYALNGLGWTQFEQGELRAARGSFEECLTIAHAISDTWRIGLTLTHLSNIAAAEGNDTEAHARIDEALVMLRASGDVGNIGWALGCLAAIALRQRDLATLCASLKEALTIWRVHHETDVVRTFEMVAMLLAEQEQPELAVRLLAVAAEMRTATGFVLPVLSVEDHQRLVSHLRATLGEHRFAALWSAGTTTSMEEAIDLALESDALSGDGQRT